MLNINIKKFRSLKFFSVGAALFLFLFLCAGVAYARFVQPAQVDLSHLAKNPPRIFNNNFNIADDNTLPASYDLRNLNLVTTPIRNQGIVGTCWSFGATAAIESNYLKNHPAISPSNIDFSEHHMVWFSYMNPDRSRRFTPSASKEEWGEIDDIRNPEYYRPYDAGGTCMMPIAYMARMDGFINESELKYIKRERFQETGLDEYYLAWGNHSKDLMPSYETVSNAELIPLKTAKPDDYAKISNLRLKEALFAASAPSIFPSDESEQGIKIGGNRIETTKKLLMEHGALGISYMAAIPVNENHAYYYPTDKTNHAVALVGWDDNFPRASFDSFSSPDKDGAWLIRNSWGDFSNSDGGYFWASYEQNVIYGTAYILEDVNLSNNEKILFYEHDPLGWCMAVDATTSETGSATAYAANIFKVLSNGEELYSVGFYTTANNAKCTINIYDLGTARPDKTKIINSTPIFTQDETSYPYAGYHTVNLTERKKLEKGHYFSVVIFFDNSESNYPYPIAVEAALDGYSDMAAAYDGESYVSSNGSSWIDPVYDNDDGDDFNACIKAFMIDTDTSDAPDNDDAKTIRGRAVNSQIDETDNFTLSALNPEDIKPEYADNFKIQVGKNGAALAKNTEVQFFCVLYDYDEFSAAYASDADNNAYPTGGLEYSGDVAVKFPKGFTPDEYMIDDGELFPAYGPFTLNVEDDNGSVNLDVNNLIYADNEDFYVEGRAGTFGKIPRGEYALYVAIEGESESGDEGLIDGLKLNATSKNIKNKSSSSGCNSGFGIFGAIIIFLALFICLFQRCKLKYYKILKIN